MEDLREWRKNSSRIAQVEATLHRPRSVTEKVARFLEMRKLWSLRLAETQEHYSAQKREYLADLQERLRKVAEFQCGRTAAGPESRPETA